MTDEILDWLKIHLTGSTILGIDNDPFNSDRLVLHTSSGLDIALDGIRSVCHVIRPGEYMDVELYKKYKTDKLKKMNNLYGAKKENEK